MAYLEDTLFGASDTFRNFVDLLFDKRRDEVLKNLGEAFRQRLLKEEGIVEGIVESARPLGSGELAELTVALGEKQKLRFQYGVLEKQFRGYYQEAARRRGITGIILLQLLECRLDNVCFRAGFGNSRQAARQMVNHGHVLVNGSRVSTPSYVIKEGDKVGVKNTDKSRHLADKNLEYSTSRNVPDWLSLDKDAYEGVVERIPTRDDIQPIANEQAIVEFYSR